MKEKRLFLPDKWLFSLLFWLLCSTFLFAQNHTSYLTWDQQVGCINYDNEYDIKRNRLILNENVEEAPCLQFCQYSEVNFKLNGNNIAHVEWEVNGGEIQNVFGNANTQATLQWDASEGGTLSITITYANGTQTTATICIKKIISPAAKFNVLGSSDFYFCVDTPNCTDLYLVKWEPLTSSLMNESSTPTTLSVHPNPATEAATVQYALGDTYQQAQRLVVYDLVGNVKHTEKLTANTGEVKLPVNYWNTGIYIISLEADNLKVASQKLIKK